MTKIKKIFAKNIIIKTACLVAAVVLWVYVASLQTSVTKLPGAIPIKSFSNQPNLVAVYDTKTVEIKVSTESAILQNLSVDSFSAYVDLSAYSAGTFEVPVTVVSSVPGVQIVEKTPNKITVSLEPVITKDVSVIKNIIGDAADGMTVGSVSFSPATASIRGAKSVIESIQEVTADIKLNGEAVGFQRDVLLGVADQRNGQDDVEITPKEVSAQVSIVKGAGIKTVGIKTVVSGSPAANFYISEIKVLPSTVDITGLASTVSETGYLETMPINVNSVSVDIEKEVQLKVPEGIYISGQSSATVLIQIKIASTDSVQEVSVSDIKLLNANGLSLVSASPSVVTIRYTGQSSLANVIKPSDFSIILDLAGKTPNAVGEFIFNLTKSMISVPDGITILEISPSNITIKTKS